MLAKKLVFKNILVFFILMFLVLSFTNIPYSIAQDITQMQNEISIRNDKIKKLEAEIDAYNNKVATTQAEAKTLKSAINKLESQKKDLQNQISLNNLKIQNTEGEILNTVDKIFENESDVEKKRKIIAKTLVEMKHNDDNNIFILNFIKSGNGNLSEFLNESYQLINFSDVLNIKIAEMNGIIDELNKNKNEYEKQKGELSDLTRDLDSKKGIVSQNQKEQNTLLTQTKNEEKEYQKIIKDRKAKVEDLEAEISNFEAKIKYTLDKGSLPSNGTGLAYPLTKYVITQNFGKTDFANSGAYNGNGHNGMDFGVAVGTKVMSAQDGVVMGTGNTDTACNKASYGKWILIKHNNGLATLYGHLSSIEVSTGQNVAQGERIGLSGNTGYSTGPHLHFTVIASDAVKIFGPTEYKSRTCGTYIVMPYAALNAYLNPADYLQK